MLKYLRVIITIVVLFFCAEESNIGAKAAHAQEKPERQIIELWECFDALQYRLWKSSLGEKGPVLARLKRLRVGNFEFGEVEVSGSTQEAKFTVQGINRRWDFGYGFKYTFLIRPNKSAAYFDFTIEKKAKPRQYFVCEK